LQPDGRLVVVGSVTLAGAYDVGLARYLYFLGFGLPPEQPSDDGAEERLRRSASVVQVVGMS
jgi:hypothetical protein